MVPQVAFVPQPSRDSSSCAVTILAKVEVAYRKRANMFKGTAAFNFKQIIFAIVENQSLRCMESKKRSYLHGASSSFKGKRLLLLLAVA